MRRLISYPGTAEHVLHYTAKAQKVCPRYTAFLHTQTLPTTAQHCSVLLSTTQQCSIDKQEGLEDLAGVVRSAIHLFITAYDASKALPEALKTFPGAPTFLSLGLSRFLFFQDPTWQSYLTLQSAPNKAPRRFQGASFQHDSKTAQQTHRQKNRQTDKQTDKQTD